MWTAIINRKNPVTTHTCSQGIFEKIAFAPPHMKAGQSLWTRDELILAINLYCKIPFGTIHNRNPKVIELAGLIGRTPSSVSYKLVNFASLDPSLKARGIKGASNASKLDGAIWAEFYNNWDAALLESERLLAAKKHTTIAALNDVAESDVPKEGLNKERLVMTRVNQSIFRSIVLATYDNSCCITGMNHPELLVASHIEPWSKDEKNRLNPMNGLCLNALHDRAFDRHLITIDADSYKVRVCKKLLVVRYFSDVDEIKIRLPARFLPGKEFLQCHNNLFLNPPPNC